jgi:hypothetical protein
VAVVLGTALLAAGSMADAKPDAAWVTYHDSVGFSLQKPAAWQVQAGRGGEIAVTEPRGTAAAMLRARVVPARDDLAQWLQQHYAATEPGLYNVRMLTAEARGAQVAHAAFDYGSNVFQGRASVVAVRHGDVATLFVAAAARSDFAQRLPELTRILDSLRFGSALPALQFARWTEHREGQAFGQGGADGQMILRFRSAERFGAQVTGTRARPDLAEIARRNPLLQHGPTAATAADIEFASRGGRIGVLTLTTFGGSGMAGAGGGMTWRADGVHGSFAPADSAATAAAAMARMLVSSGENPRWAAGEAGHQRRMGQQYQAFLRWSQELQQQAIARRWQADETRRGGVLGGTVRLHDPSSGETFEAAARDRYYFRVNRADPPTALGSDTDAKPLREIDLTRLLQIGTEVPDR